MRLQITLAGDVTVGRAPEDQRDDERNEVGDDRDDRDRKDARLTVTGPPRIVLAALVLEREAPLARDRLAGIVWPEEMPRTWASALRTYVSRARLALTQVLGVGGEVIASGDAGYQLALPHDVELVIDVERAAGLLDRARAALAADPALALEDADAAAAAVRAPFLAGHPGQWADDVRARLDDLVVGALLVAGEAAAAVGDGPGAVAAAEEATQRAPLHEAAHRALMAAHEAAGNRAEALRSYQRARRQLADELGVDPSAETEAAYLALLGPAPPARPTPTTDPATAGAVRPWPGSAGRAGTPFVGREAELGVLAAAWDQASQGARHVVVVTGEAGIGKSRLAGEAALRVAQAGGQVLFGRCDQEAIVPYQPIVEALDAVVAATPAEDMPRLGPEATAELAAILPAIGGPIRPSPPDRARLFAAVTDLVASLADARPLLLVLDDLQWADDDTLLLLRHLLRRAGSAPVLVVAISRDHDLDPGSALAEVVHALDRDGWVRRVALRGLDEGDVRRLLGHLLGAGDHRDAARRVLAETAGNPFLVTEVGLARGTTASGGDVDPGDIARGDIPQGVHDLVTSRLGRLDDAVVDLLRAAAVTGVGFDLDIAAAVAGLEGDPVLDAVDAALRTRSDRRGDRRPVPLRPRHRASRPRGPAQRGTPAGVAQADGRRRRTPPGARPRRPGRRPRPPRGRGRRPGRRPSGRALGPPGVGSGRPPPRPGRGGAAVPPGARPHPTRRRRPARRGDHRPRRGRAGRGRARRGDHPRRRGDARPSPRSPRRGRPRRAGAGRRGRGPPRPPHRRP